MADFWLTRKPRAFFSRMTLSMIQFSRRDASGCPRSAASLSAWNQARAARRTSLIAIRSPPARRAARDAMLIASRGTPSAARTSSSNARFSVKPSRTRSLSLVSPSTRSSGVDPGRQVLEQQSSKELDGPVGVLLVDHELVEVDGAGTTPHGPLTGSGGRRSSARSTRRPKPTQLSPTPCRQSAAAPTCARRRT